MGVKAFGVLVPNYSLEGHDIGTRQCKGGWCIAGGPSPCECGGVLHSNLVHPEDYAFYLPRHNTVAMGPQMWMVCDRCGPADGSKIDWLLLEDEADEAQAR